jgi:hypothetical protein
MKGDPVLEAPNCKTIDPPLLPVNSTLGPFKILTTVPGLASISKIAGENGVLPLS